MKLSEIQYQRPNMDILKQTLENLCTQFENATDATTQLEVIHQVNELQLEFNSQFVVVGIRHDLNSFDKFYEQERAFFNEQDPVFDNYLASYYQLLLDSSFRKTLEEKLGKRFFQCAQFFIEERNQQTESIEQEINQLEGEYFKSLSQGTVVFQEEKYSLRGICKFNDSKDTTIRKTARDIFYNFWVSKTDDFHHAFDKMVQLRDKASKVLGFENVVEESYHSCDYNGEQVSTFNKAVLKHFVPLQKRLYERRLKRMDVEEVHYYDTVKYKSGNPSLEVDSKKLWEKTQKMYAELSPETDEFCRFMVENELYDTENRKGKYTGAYMASIKKYGLPFIFANFTGRAHDFRTLTHEMGHAFQMYQTYKEGVREIELLQTQNDIAEIHAIAMELFTRDWHSLFFKEDAAKMQFRQISDMLGTITYCCLSEDFQQFVYRNPNVTPTQRNQKWLEINKAYQPYLTETSRSHPYLKAGHNWQMNGHIMCMPFYAVDYSLATLCAFQFWMKSKENKEETWEDYLRLCKIGGKYSYFEALQLANLRSPFDETVIKEIAEFLGTWLDGVDDSGF
ncbi:MAG: M3 family oligoendopeptidase [Chitinophagales bacterium]